MHQIDNIVQPFLKSEIAVENFTLSNGTVKNPLLQLKLQEKSDTLLGHRLQSDIILHSHGMGKVKSLSRSLSICNHINMLPITLAFWTCFISLIFHFLVLSICHLPIGGILGTASPSWMVMIMAGRFAGTGLYPQNCTFVHSCRSSATRN